MSSTLYTTLSWVVRFFSGSTDFVQPPPSEEIDLFLHYKFQFSCESRDMNHFVVEQLNRTQKKEIKKIKKFLHICSSFGFLRINVTFVDKDGEETHIKVPVGMSMLEAAHENDIDLEGACEGSLACSTCHVIVMDMAQYNKLPDPTDEENDMLDLAFGLTETSRLGCQIIAEPELDGLHLAIPSATRNFAVDGFKPKPH
ncbi:hypothetical protein RD792_015746 [Penstemon davidsonii]|uniref:2Fe-2S ferredoxin n=1 Tax=Penstemon davidsonii TaxID=160366 RepID=A0ABR0CHT9_9LAMI|nr:hypothetical protein RD792_015746 [Penstemon davidsonii]